MKKDLLTKFVNVIKRIYVSISPIILLLTTYLSIVLINTLLNNGFLSKLLTESISYRGDIFMIYLGVFIIVSLINFIPLIFLLKSIKKDGHFKDFRYINTISNIFLTTLLEVLLFLYFRNSISQYQDVIEPLSFTIFLPIIAVIIGFWIITSIVMLIKPHPLKDIITSSIFIIFSFSIICYPFEFIRDELVYNYIKDNRESLVSLKQSVVDRITTDQSFKSTDEFSNEFIKNNFRQIEVIILNDNKQPYKLFNSSCNEYYGSKYNVSRITTETSLSVENIRSFIDPTWQEDIITTQYSRNPYSTIQNISTDNNQIEDSDSSESQNNSDSLLSNDSDPIPNQDIQLGLKEVSDNPDLLGENSTANSTDDADRTKLENYKSACYMIIRNKTIKNSDNRHKYSWINKIIHPLISNKYTDLQSDSNLDQYSSESEINTDYKKPSLFIYITKHEVDSEKNNNVDNTKANTNTEPTNETETVPAQKVDVVIMISLFDYKYTLL